jgi:hypothetical protein
MELCYGVDINCPFHDDLDIASRFSSTSYPVRAHLILFPWTTSLNPLDTVDEQANMPLEVQHTRVTGEIEQIKTWQPGDKEPPKRNLIRW